MIIQTTRVKHVAYLPGFKNNILKTVLKVYLQVLK